jgi:hypothetical protein
MGVDHAVAGVQDAAVAAHQLPPCDRIGLVLGLAVDLALELQHRVAPDHQRARSIRGDGDRFELGEPEHQRRRILGVDLRLVHAADGDLGLQTGVLQELESGRGC